MALVVPVVTGLVLVNLASVALVGVSSPQFALGVATGFVTYATSGMSLVTIDTGSLGIGIGAGQGIILPPPAIIPSMAACLLGSLVAGVMSAPTAVAVSNGISQSFALATIVTAHVGVGAGSGIVKIIPNPNVSIPSFISGFAAAGMAGVMAVATATAIATALDMALMSATGVVVIAGPASPFPGSGVGTGKLL